MTPEELDDKALAALDQERTDRKAGKLGPVRNPSEISREIIGAMQRHIDPEDVARVLASMLGATRQHKGGMVLPDTRAQEAAAKLYLAYVVGMPVQRSESVTVTLDADQGRDIAERLRHSPALREAMRKALAESEAVDV